MFYLLSFRTSSNFTSVVSSLSNVTTESDEIIDTGSDVTYAVLLNYHGTIITVSL